MNTPFSERRMELRFAMGNPEASGAKEAKDVLKFDPKLAKELRVNKAEDLALVVERLEKDYDPDAMKLLSYLEQPESPLQKSAAGKAILANANEQLKKNPDVVERVGQEELRRELWKYCRATDTWGPSYEYGKAYGGKAFMYKRMEDRGVPVLAAYIPSYDRNPALSIAILNLTTGKWAFRNPADFGIKPGELQKEYAGNTNVSEVNGSEQSMTKLKDNTTLEDNLLKKTGLKASDIKAFDASDKGASWKTEGTENDEVRKRVLDVSPIRRTDYASYLRYNRGTNRNV